LFSQVFDYRQSNRIRQDLMLNDESILEENNYRDEKEVLQFIEDTMQAHLIPGLSISIVKDGNIVWEEHFGYANIDENIIVDENTLFMLASISKTVTATALMQLFEDGLFSLDDDIDDSDAVAVEFAMATRFQADKDLVIIKNVRGSSLDPSSDQKKLRTTKMGIDATIPASKRSDGFKLGKIPKTKTNLKDYLKK